MTFFLPETGPTPEIKAKQPPKGISTTLEGWGAGITKSDLERDANLVAHRTKLAVQRGLSEQVIDRLPLETVKPFLLGDAGKFSTSVQGLDNITDEEDARAAVKEIGGRHMDRILELAREDAVDNPDAWADVDLTPEGIEAEVNRRLKAQRNDAQEILHMMPNGSGMAEFMGGMISMVKDIKNLPFMVVGGGSGSFMRVMGREAMINASAEAVFLPSQFQMAERLDIPDPDVATQLLMAAGAGAGFGLGFEATRRGFRYFTVRNEFVPASGYDNLSMNVMVDEAEDVLAGGKPDALNEIAQIPFKTTRTSFPDNPINPDRPPLSDFADAFLETLDRPPNVSKQRADNVRQLRAQASDESLNLPDNLRSEMRARARELEDGASGGLIGELSDLEIPNTFFVPRDQLETMSDRELDELLADWFDRSGYSSVLSDVEMLEVRAEYGTRGDDPESLIERVLEREADFVEGKFDGLEGTENVPFEGPGRTDGSATGEPAITTSEARGGVEGQGGRRADADQPEVTIASEQPVDPRTTATGTIERLEGRPDGPLRGLDADTGAFSVPARGQTDAFNDVTSTEARAVHDMVTDDLRSQVEVAGNIEVEIELPDGTTRAMNVSEALEHLDAGDRFSARLSLCGKGLHA